MIFAIILAVVLVLLIAWYISVMNKIKTTQVKIAEARSGIDIALTKRFDILTKLLDITKAYANHEKFTIIETIKMRKGMSVAECSEINAKLNETAHAINMVAEAYPELRSSENFKRFKLPLRTSRSTFRLQDGFTTQMFRITISLSLNSRRLSSQIQSAQRLRNFSKRMTKREATLKWISIPKINGNVHFLCIAIFYVLTANKCSVTICLPNKQRGQFYGTLDFTL